MATAEPFCQNVRPICPTSGDQFTERTATRTLKNNEAMKAQCGGGWAKCPKGALPYGPPAPAAQSTPEPKTS